MNTELTITGPASIESYAENIQQKLQVCDLLLKSGMLPPQYKSHAGVLAAILYGKELGFSPMRALNVINVIQGRPTLSAEGLKGLAIKHGAIIRTVEWSDQVCKLTCKRGDWEETSTYTIEDAKKQELTSKDNWRKMPKAMLYARAVSSLVRNMFADVLGGFYSTEEITDSPPQLKEVKPPIELAPTVAADDLPSSFTAAPKKPDSKQVIKDAIEGGDLQTIGDHVITTRCSFNGVTIREAFNSDSQKVIDSLSKFNDLDKPAVTAYMDAIGL